MLIECKIKRKGGSRIIMVDGTAYHFTPDPDGRHVAFVTEPAHIERLLSIPEGYRIAPGGAAAGPVTPVGAKPQGITAQEPADLIVTENSATTPATTEPGRPADGALNREALEALYLKATGKKPHPAAKDETLLTAIKAARETTE